MAQADSTLMAKIPRGRGISSESLATKAVRGAAVPVTISGDVFAENGLRAGVDLAVGHDELDGSRACRKSTNTKCFSGEF